jgi:AcrR family transcriptional regulator
MNVVTSVPLKAPSTDRPGVYSSRAIVARRLRILRETRKLIAKGGIAAITMDEVARRAGVVKRTLYNAFQSKERLVAAAIQQYFDDYASRVTHLTEEATLESILERLIIVARRNLAIRNYTRALMDIYFSREVDPDIRGAIHQIAADSQLPLLRNLAKKRQWQRWVTVDSLSDRLVRLRYSTAHDWAEGLISDQDFLVELLRGFFSLLAGSTCGAARTQIDAILSSLTEHPMLTLDYVDQEPEQDN